MPLKMGKMREKGTTGCRKRLTVVSPRDTASPKGHAISPLRYEISTSLSVTRRGAEK